MTKKIEEVMARSLKYIDGKSTLQQAHDEMTRLGVRHLLVQDGAGKLAGMISDRDIKKYVSPFAGATSATDRDKATLKIEVQKVMTKSLITLKPDDKVKQAAEVMLQKHINGVPIVDADGKGVGIVTSTDLLRLLISML